MPGANLTRVEAGERKAVVSAPIHYWVSLDLTVGAEDFASTTKVTFDAQAGASTFLDLIANQVTEVVLNGEALDPAAVFVDSRIELNNLKDHNEVVVKAMCQYSNTGEGLHRSVDPADGNVYLYSQFEVPDARPRLRRVRPARPEGRVRLRRDRSGKLDRAVEPAGAHRGIRGRHDPGRHAGRPPGRAHQALGVRADRDDELLPDRHLRRPVRAVAHRVRERGRPRRADGPVLPPVAGRGLRQGRRLPVRRHQEGLRVLRQDLGHPVPVRQVRPDLRAGVQRGRDGEHRPGHDPRPVRVRLQGDRRRSPNAAW